MPHLYYTILQNAHEAALKHVFFAKPTGTVRVIELYNARIGRLIKQYVKRLDGSARAYGDSYAKSIEDYEAEARMDAPEAGKVPRNDETKKGAAGKRRTHHAGDDSRAGAQAKGSGQAAESSAAISAAARNARRP
jgi:hypothetical protein